jgi:hypothetical protein
MVDFSCARLKHVSAHLTTKLKKRFAEIRRSRQFID